jgi:hypothetical protein
MTSTFFVTRIAGVIPPTAREFDGQNIQDSMVVGASGEPVDELAVDQCLAYRDEALR